MAKDRCILGHRPQHKSSNQTKPSSHRDTHHGCRSIPYHSYSRSCVHCFCLFVYTPTYVPLSSRIYTTSLRNAIPYAASPAGDENAMPYPVPAWPWIRQVRNADRGLPHDIETLAQGYWPDLSPASPLLPPSRRQMEEVERERRNYDVVACSALELGTNQPKLKRLDRRSECVLTTDGMTTVLPACSTACLRTSTLRH
ncbi:hypothetical protein BKA80DRAFT_18396 [Phyllosticta citrichinensis]